VAKTFARGQVWRADVPFNEEPAAGKYRPVVIVGFSRFGPTEDGVLLVVPVTSFGQGGQAKNGDVEIVDHGQAGLRGRSLQDAAEVRHPEGRHYMLHEARHTTATLLLEAGVSEAVIIAIMGHSSIAVTRGYQHVSQTLARKAMDDVAAKLGLTAA
jgi:mRNA-degrading endonuclease toxin of MazEF toxin-antitoxin module